MDKVPRTVQKTLKKNGYIGLVKKVEGGFGEIYEAKVASTLEEVIIKLIKITDKKQQRQMEREIHFLNIFSQKNCKRYRNNKNKRIEKEEMRIVQMKEILSVKRFFQNNKYLIVVMEKMEMDLMDLILSRKSPLPLSITKYLFQQLCMAVKQMHDQGVAHLDLKPDNVLLNININNNNNNDDDDEENVTIELKICDFGFSEYFNRGPTRIPSLLGTIEYMPPEVYYTFDEFLPSDFQADKFDIWSLGVILFSMVTKRFPYKYSDIEFSDSFDKIIHYTRDDRCIDLVSQMLNIEPSKRPSIDQILQHPWFDPMDSDQF